MMLIRFTILIWLLPGVWALAQMRQVVTYYDQARTQVREKYAISNTKPPVLQGAYERFYANGRLQAKGMYRQGLPEGQWEYFYENGRPKMAGQLHRNKKNGFWKYYFENGQPQMEGSLRDDRRTGHWKYYYESGNPKSEGDFADDQKNGSWLYFYEDGRKKAEGSFIHDKGWYREYYTSGKMRMEGLLVKGKSDSTWRYYHENGKLKATGTEKNGIRENSWRFYDENEMLLQEGDYKNGIPEGKWRFYHPNGKIAVEGQKTAGKEDGIWNLFYTSGAARGMLNYNRPDGNYEEYYENGKLKARGTIQNDLHEGIWQYFYEDDGTQEGRCEFVAGKGLYKGIYKDGKPRMEGRLENDRRVGRWTLYQPDGSIAGYYEAFYDQQLPTSARSDSTVTADTLNRSTMPYKKPSLRLPKRRNWHFVTKPNEYRAFIVGLNPIALFWRRNPSLPLSVEYYMHERLGYEVTATIYRQPFFTSNAAITLNENYSRGFSLGLKQKFYQADGDWGMFYVAHEIRFTGINHQANILDLNLSRLTIRATETRYEYSFMAGTRILDDPSRKTRKLTLDAFAGADIAYRHYSPQWSNRPEWDAIFSEVPKRNFLLTLRLGVMLGYTF